MVDIPNMSFIQDRLESGLQGAQQAYEQGVNRRSDDFWQSQTLNSEQAWVDGVQESINNGTWAAGVSNPIRSWQARSSAVGGRRLTQDTQGAAEAYGTAFAPFRDRIEAIDLSPRGARGSPQNFQRSQELGEDLHNLSLNR